MHTSKLILLNTSQYFTALNDAILEFEKDTLNNDEAEIKEIKLVNLIPYPDLLETIISNELISKNMSEYSHYYVYSGLINLRKLAKYETIDFYQKSLEEMILLLDLEIEYQKGEINLQDFDAQVKIGKEKIEHKTSTKNVLEIESK